MRLNNSATGAVKVQIANASGKQVLSRNFNSGNKIDLNLESFAPGFYIVTLISGEQTVSQKIMVL